MIKPQYIGLSATPQDLDPTFFRVRDHSGRRGASVPKNVEAEQQRASQRRWLEPIGQNGYVWTAGTRGRIRIRFLVRVQ